jgi:hypothetical protein
VLELKAREADMLAREIIHTCSNIHVARAALASIGGEFAAQVAKRANEKNLTAGAFVAHVVKDFSRRAGEDEWDGVDEAARGADQPILSGLRYILGSRLGMNAGSGIFVGGARQAPWTMGAAGGCLCAI